MKKKVSLVCLVLVCALCCMFGFAACGNTGTGNKAGRYKKVCENIYAAINEICASGSGAKTANVSAYNSVKSAKAVDESMYVEGNADDYMNVLGVNAFVGMLGDMLGNDKFVITTKPVAFTHSYEPIGETCASVLHYDFDEQNNKVVMKWSVNSSVGTRTDHMFVYISTDYDFAKNEVKAFTVFNYAESNLLLCYNVYENEKLWKLKDDAAQQSVLLEIESLKAQMQEAMKDTIDLEADFTAEYTKAMNIMNPDLAA